MGGIFTGGIFGKSIMEGVFGKPKVTKAPPVPAPEAVPDVGKEPSEFARRRRPRGRRETILTGDLVPDETGKKKVLG